MERITPAPSLSDRLLNLGRGRRRQIAHLFEVRHLHHRVAPERIVLVGRWRARRRPDIGASNKDFLDEYGRAVLVQVGHELPDRRRLAESADDVRHRIELTGLARFWTTLPRTCIRGRVADDFLNERVECGLGKGRPAAGRGQRIRIFPAECNDRRSTAECDACHRTYQRENGEPSRSKLVGTISPVASYTVIFARRKVRKAVDPLSAFRSRLVSSMTHTAPAVSPNSSLISAYDPSGSRPPSGTTSVPDLFHRPTTNAER